MNGVLNNPPINGLIINGFAWDENSPTDLGVIENPTVVTGGSVAQLVGDVVSKFGPKTWGSS